MTRHRLAVFLAYAVSVLFVCALMAWMIDKTVARYQDQWERQTSGMASPRPSGSD